MAFRYEFTPSARQSVLDAQDYVLQFSEEGVSRFAYALQAAVGAICDETRPRQPFDETGSLAFSRPVYLRLFSTAKKRRRGSSAGTWWLYYSLTDTNGDGQVDTVLVLLVSHAAAKPLTSWLDDFSDDTDDA